MADVRVIGPPVSVLSHGMRPEIDERRTGVRRERIPRSLVSGADGFSVAATPESGAATLNTTQFPANILRAWPSDPEAKDAYPIATFTWLLLYKTYSDKDKLAALKKFVTYGLTDGQKLSGDLGYIPLPPEVVQKCQTALNSVQ